MKKGMTTHNLIQNFIFPFMKVRHDNNQIISSSSTGLTNSRLRYVSFERKWIISGIRLDKTMKQNDFEPLIYILRKFDICFLKHIEVGPHSENILDVIRKAVDKNILPHLEAITYSMLEADATYYLIGDLSSLKNIITLRSLFFVEENNNILCSKNACQSR